MADKAAKDMREAAEAAEGELDELRAEIERLTKALNDAKAMLKDEARERVAEGLETLEDSAEALKEKMQDGLQDLQKHITDNPIPASIAAFAIGVVLGRLIAR